MSVAEEAESVCRSTQRSRGTEGRSVVFQVHFTLRQQGCSSTAVVCLDNDSWHSCRNRLYARLVTQHLVGSNSAWKDALNTACLDMNCETWDTLLENQEARRCGQHLTWTSLSRPQEQQGTVEGSEGGKAP